MNKVNDFIDHDSIFHIYYSSNPISCLTAELSMKHLDLEINNSRFYKPLYDQYL